MPVPHLPVCDALVDSFGELVFTLSNNVQERRGDPVRERNFAAIEAQRPALGLSDAEIAARVGLGVDAVVWIRNVVERRRIERSAYRRLHTLGGGRRYRGEPPDAAGAAPSAERGDRLRDALRFDPGQVCRFVQRGWWNGDTLRSWLERHAGESPERIALDDGVAAVSYGELLERVQRLACGLRRLGIGPGDVVAVQLPNVAEYLVAYLAIACCGAVMTTIYLPYRARESETLLAHSAAVACLCLPEIGDYRPPETLLALRERLPAFEHVVVLGDAPPGAVAWAELAGQPAEPFAAGVPAAADPFLLLYTSGTTASPKAVPHPYQTLLGNARAGVAEHGLDATDRILSAAPFGHLFGLYSVHLALAAGATTLLLPTFTPAGLAGTLTAQRPTALFSAPANLLACLGAGVLDGEELASLRLVVLSGSVVPGDLVERLEARMPHGTVTQLWGMTETQAGIYTRPGDPPDAAARGAGRPSPGTEVRIADPLGDPLPDGEEGELLVRGSLLFPGYLDNDDANAAAFTGDGWFRTGDLAVRGADGNVALTGRLKDLINRGGVKINPRDVEELLARHPAVAQAAIVAQPDPVLGERACLFVVPAGDAEPTLEALCAFLAEQQVAKIRHPERLVLIDEMPMTATRKVIKARLRP